MSVRTDILQLVRPASIEPVDPVTRRLAMHGADTRGLLPIQAVENHRQRQKPAALVGVPRPRREAIADRKPNGPSGVSQQQPWRESF